MSRLIFDAATLGGTTTLSSVDAVGNFTIDVPAATGPLLIPTTVGIAGQALISSGTAVPIWQTAGTGTVTSVSFTGGLISVANPTSTPTLTVAGTSGGVPYFTSASTWASSAVLAANALMIGGGAGATPATTATGTGVVTALGVNIGTAGSFVLDGGALGTPSSGTVTNLTGTASININGTVGATTAAAGAFTTLTTSANAIISDNSANAALRITQIGAGNALVVEDSANPDATPFVVTAAGDAIFGSTTQYGAGLYTTPVVNVNYGNGSTISGMAINAWGLTGTTAPRVTFARSSGSLGTYTSVVDSSNLGGLFWHGADGTAFIQAASISSAVDGTPGTNDMPGRLMFSTTADGASSVTERMRIDSAGQVGIGAASTTGVNLFVGKNVTGATTSVSVLAQSTIQSDVTTSAFMFRSRPSTAAAAFTLPTLIHYAALQNTIGATSTVTNQFGFQADSSLTGATNNYGFYGNIASGTGRYNFYAAGTAENVFVGTTSIGGTVGAESLRVTPVASAVNYWNLFGNTTAGGVRFLAEGSDTDVNAVIGTKGAGIILFRTGGGLTDQFRIAHTASAVNYLQVTGSAGTTPTLSAQGSGANLDIALTPKGTGVLSFGTYTAGIIAQAGYISIKDAGGTTRRLLVG